MNKNESLELLRGLAQEGRGLARVNSAGFTKFRQRGHMILRRIFGEDSDYVDSWDSTSFRPRRLSLYSDNSAQYQDAWQSGMEVSLAQLETAMEEISRFGGDAAGPQTKIGVSRKVFVVHGHDEGLMQAVARMLEQLDLEAIILHEQPNEGRTIIEKFEDFSDVSFAVVLLTPDDMGYRTGEDSDTARPRARQNVILELGFFLGKLGRGHVAVLHSGDESFERPSDYDGVLYIPIDDGGQWQFGLVRELKAAGIEVDANRIIGK